MWTPRLQMWLLMKPATLETGKEVQVPTFIEIGDVLQIDTRDGRVIKRV